jgi:phosphohistidine phosphatase SixA
MGVRKAVREVDDLRPGADFRLLGGELADLSLKRRIALVGHEPDLGLLATWLLAGVKISAIQFKKGGAACIETGRFDPPSENQLLWLLTPSQMAHMAR